MTPLEAVLDRLEDVRGDAGQLKARCPAHDDREPSLGVREAEDGRVLLTCRAGCKTPDVVAALHLAMSDLFPATRDKRSELTLQATYPYVDEVGKSLFEVLRFIDGKGEKTFRQRAADGSWKMNGTRRVLYRLPRVLAALEAGEPVFICEGEKDVESIERAGDVATTNPAGAEQWKAEYAEIFAGTTSPIIVVADRDKAGAGWASNVTDSLRRVGVQPTLTEALVGKDVTDHLAAGHTLEELQVVAAVADDRAPAPDTEVLPDDWPPEWEAVEEPHDRPMLPSPIERLRGAVVRGVGIKDLPRPEPLVDGLLDRNTLAALYGPSGSGKSFVAVALALHVGTGTWWFGREVREGGVLYVAGEGAAGIGARVDAWQHHQRLYGDLGSVSWLTFPPNLSDVAWSAATAELAAELGPSLVVIDTLARSMVGADENSAKDVGMVVEGAERVRRASGACVLLVHHTGKDGSAGMRGSSALRAAMSTELEVKGGDGAVVLANTKQRDREEAAPLYLRLVPVRESCVLDRSTGALADDDDLPQKAIEVLRALADVAVEGGVAAGVWEAAAVDAGVSRATFFRHRKALESHDLCLNLGSDVRPRLTPSEQGLSLLRSHGLTEVSRGLT